MSDNYPKELWTVRTPEETRAMYAEWANAYESDVADGYATPKRLARALAQASPDKTASVLDFGCGTGLSGMALAAEGFSTIDGTDITPEMLEFAREKPCYRTIWTSQPEDRIPTDHYTLIAAVGVVSLGAAPAQTLDMLLDALPRGGLLAFSYNDPTLLDEGYMTRLAGFISDGVARIVSEDYGPHLASKDMNSTVYILEKTS